MLHISKYKEDNDNIDKEDLGNLYNEFNYISIIDEILKNPDKNFVVNTDSLKIINTNKIYTLW